MLNDWSVVLALAMMRILPAGPHRNVCPSPDRTATAALLALSSVASACMMAIV
jgi:hypothetical protein